MRIRTSSQSRRERGTTAVELALMIPLITMLVVGCIDLGRGVWAKHSLEHVVGDAVRWAAVNGDSSSSPMTEATMETRVRSALPYLDSEELTVTTTWSPNNRPGSDVTVNLSYNFDPIIPFMSMEAFALSAAATSVISY